MLDTASSPRPGGSKRPAAEDTVGEAGVVASRMIVDVPIFTTIIGREFSIGAILRNEKEKQWSDCTQLNADEDVRSKNVRSKHLRSNNRRLTTISTSEVVRISTSEVVLAQVIY